MSKSIGELLQSARKARKMSQEDLANAINASGSSVKSSKSSVYRAEKNLSNLTLEETKVICETLDIPPSYFFESLGLDAAINDNQDVTLKLPVNRHTLDLIDEVIKDLKKVISVINVRGNMSLDSYPEDELGLMFLKLLVSKMSGLSDEEVNILIKRVAGSDKSKEKL